MRHGNHNNKHGECRANCAIRFIVKIRCITQELRKSKNLNLIGILQAIWISMECRGLAFNDPQTIISMFLCVITCEDTKGPLYIFIAITVFEGTLFQDREDIKSFRCKDRSAAFNDRLIGRWLEPTWARSSLRVSTSLQSLWTNHRMWSNCDEEPGFCSKTYFSRGMKLFKSFRDDVRVKFSLIIS